MLLSPQYFDSDRSTFNAPSSDEQASIGADDLGQVPRPGFLPPGVNVLEPRATGPASGYVPPRPQPNRVPASQFTAGQTAIAQEPGAGGQRRRRPLRRFFENRKVRSFVDLNDQSAQLCLIVCCCLLLVIVAFVLFFIFFPNISNRNRVGCTFSDFDNFDRGFGIEGGNCTAVHEQNRVRFCDKDNSTLQAFYTDSGGRFGNYSNNEQSVLIFESLRAEKSLCVDFLEFNVVGDDDDDQNDDCPKDRLSVEGSLRPQEDNVPRCNANAFSRQTLTCSQPGGELKFTFESDNDRNASGWLARLQCGVPGCTNPRFSNFDPLATLDDGTCVELHGVSDLSTFCGRAVYYDSGGPEANYEPSEFAGRRFKSSDPERVLCFEFVQFSVLGGSGNSCNADRLTVENSENSADNRDYCNGAVTPVGRGKICSKLGQEIRFNFESTSSGQSSGWKAYITCEAR